MTAAVQRFAEFTDADILGQFRDAARARDIELPDSIVADGRLHRCNAAGRGGKGDAAYLLHFDKFPAGGLQNHRDGLGWETWKADIGRQPTPAEHEDLRRKAAAARAEREADDTRRKAEAAVRAASIWAKAEPCVDHPYLTRKGVGPHGLQLSRGDLVVPVRDVGGTLHSLQFITADGAKKFLFGGRVRGCFHIIGDPGEVICIAEGFATAATLFEVTGHAVVVAFDAGNLTAVAEAIRAQYPAARIVICADDDHLALGNPGIAKAREAADAVTGIVAVPNFGAARPEKMTDFNDLKQRVGSDAVVRTINVALAEYSSGQRWPEPDMSVLRLYRRSPPVLPLRVFGPWGDWIAHTAEAAACAPDYVAAPLLAATSALIGHARWPQATPGWAEPPHLWLGAVGDSGAGKSPGADCLTRDVLPEIERRMLADFPERLLEWRAATEMHHAKEEAWKAEVRAAEKTGKSPPLPPAIEQPLEPQAPRLRQNDVTVEKIAELLGTAAPKGLFVMRDELMGFFAGMNAYNDAGRAFWIESYGGRPYRVERKKHPEPIVIPRLAVALYGGTQPEKVSAMMRDADDGLLSRLLWIWPDPIPFRLGQAPAQLDWAIRALDRLRELDLQPGSPARPVMVPLAKAALPLLEAFGRDMQERQAASGGLLRSAYGKARGHALRLSLVLEFLWWCAVDGMAPPPAEISARAFAAATAILADYFMPGAERVYGDAATSPADRNSATLARWIMRDRPTEVHVRRLQREIRLPGLAKAEDIHNAAAALVEADWLSAPEPATKFGTRTRNAYPVNPRLADIKL